MWILKKCYTKTMLKDNLKMYGVYKFTLRNIYTGEEEVTIVKNLIPTAGRSAIASWLTASSPSPASLRLNYTALGTGATAPANGDVQLQTETYRKAIASATNASNVAYATAFYTAPEVSGTFTEAGIFMNATGTANSGTLFSRVAVSITKSTSQSLTIDYTITIS